MAPKTQIQFYSEISRTSLVEKIGFIFAKSNLEYILIVGILWLSPLPHLGFRDSDFPYSRAPCVGAHCHQILTRNGNLVHKVFRFYLRTIIVKRNEASECPGAGLLPEH